MIYYLCMNRMLQLSLTNDTYKRINTESTLFHSLMKESLLFYHLFMISGFHFDHGISSLLSS